MDNTFIGTTHGFTVSGAASADYGKPCSTYYLAGGPLNMGAGSYIEKMYSGLAAHFRARVTFFFVKVDSWNGESVLVYQDGSSVATSLTFSATEDSSVMKLCGNSGSSEAIRPVDLVFLHSSSSLTLKITTSLAGAASAASWGIYQLTVSIDTCNSVYCTSCSGPTASDCLSCISGLFLQAAGPSTCESLCPDGFYSDSSTNTCPNCNTACKKCSGPSANECLSCNAGKYLLVQAGTSQCVDSCPSTHYPDNDNNCMPCDTTCATCSGSLPTNCKSCSLPRYYIDGQCVLQCPGAYFGENSTATCIRDCPDQTFGYSVSKICCPCNNCLKCSGFGSNQCISCTGTLLIQETTCVTTCSSDFFYNQANSSCDGRIFSLKY